MVIISAHELPKTSQASTPKSQHRIIYTRFLFAEVLIEVRPEMPAVEEKPKVVDAPAVVPRAAGDPPPPFASWCDWARDGLAKALEGAKQSSGGVTEYHIGTRGLHREGLSAQVNNVAYWNQLVKFYCGVDGLPGSVTGADSACRIIPRDV